MHLEEKFITLARELADLKSIYTETGKNLLREGLAALFDKHPTIEAVKYKQYAPDFADGDYSPASVNKDDFDVIKIGQGTDEEEEEDRMISAGSWARNNRSPGTESEKFAFDLAEFMERIPNDIFFSLFGEGVEVTLHRDGRQETEEYYNY